MHDEDLERVLKSAGLRDKPPAEVERAVRSRLHAEWRAVVSERSRRSRHRVLAALAAGVAAVAVGVWLIAPGTTGSADPVATVALASGEVRVTSGWLDRWHRVAGGRSLLEGQTLETGSTGLGALALPGGNSARIDRDSRIVVAAADRIVLERGTLYVDSGGSPLAAAPLEVVTPGGSVRHIGTQYEIRLLDAAVRLRVRDGTVEWRSNDGDIERSASGEQLTITNDGRVEREPTPAYGAAWDWAAEAAPAIDIEGMPLAAFLGWAARETGREVVYASPQTEAEVASIVVHGSIAGLAPAEALDAVLGTTSVRAAVSGGSLVVDSR
jgi:ferric-dicitrate binding protein FerR (iron transport regulator)